MRIRLAAAAVLAATVAAAVTAGTVTAAWPGRVLAADSPTTAPGSPLAKVSFPVPPFPLADDGTYAGFMADVAKSMKRTCGTLEAYGWELTGADAAARQEQAATIVTSTLANVKKVGYRLDEAKGASLPDPEMVAFTAEKERLTLLLVWAPLPDSVMLLLCEATPSG